MKAKSISPFVVRLNPATREAVLRAAKVRDLSVADVLCQSILLGLPRFVAETPQPNSRGYIMSPELEAEVNAALAADPKTDICLADFKKLYLKPQRAPRHHPKSTAAD
jgi:hypothetical protein